VNNSTLPPDGWVGFQFRQGDIVIATTPKSGTTWMQMICALLIFQTPELPASLSELSPWLDHNAPSFRKANRARLAAQSHRRFIKTHTPLGQIPFSPQVTHIVVARHPLDARISQGYHNQNLLEWLQPTAGPTAPGCLAGVSGSVSPSWRPPSNALLSWIDAENNPDSLRGTMRFLCDAWRRRSEPNVTLVHYDDLSADLESEMRRISELLGIAVPSRIWPQLVEAASFEQMRSRADRLVPDPEFFKDTATFFRRGKPGAWRDILTDDEYAYYLARASELAPPDLAAWLHRQHVD